MLQEYPWVEDIKLIVTHVVRSAEHGIPLPNNFEEIYHRLLNHKAACYDSANSYDCNMWGEARDLAEFAIAYSDTNSNLRDFLIVRENDFGNRNVWRPIRSLIGYLKGFGLRISNTIKPERANNFSVFKQNLSIQLRLKLTDIAEFVNSNNQWTVEIWQHHNNLNDYFVIVGLTMNGKTRWKVEYGPNETIAGITAAMSLLASFAVDPVTV